MKSLSLIIVKISQICTISDPSIWRGLMLQCIVILVLGQLDLNADDIRRVVYCISHAKYFSTWQSGLFKGKGNVSAIHTKRETVLDAMFLTLPKLSECVECQSLSMSQLSSEWSNHMTWRCHSKSGVYDTESGVHQLFSPKIHMRETMSFLRTSIKSQ